MISSVHNDRIKAAQRLRRRRHRQQSGTLFVEGLRLVRDAWQAGVVPHVLFVAPDLVADNQAAIGLLGEIEASPAEVCPCTRAVFAKLAETINPQGIAAILPLPQLDLPKTVDLVLLLDGIRDPGNAGTLLRSAEAAGVQLALFGPQTVDPFNDKVVRAGMGAHFRLPIRTCATWPEAEILVPSQLTTFVADANSKMDYDQVDWRRPAALIVGGEAAGASDTARAMATGIRIPMAGATESLNAGIAGAVILFEAQRQRRRG